MSGGTSTSRQIRRWSRKGEFAEALHLLQKLLVCETYIEPVIKVGIFSGFAYVRVTWDNFCTDHCIVV